MKYLLETNVFRETGKTTPQAHVARWLETVDNALRRGNGPAPATTSPQKTVNVSQPCQTTGRPHPQPYRFAGNQ